MAHHHSVLKTLRAKTVFNPRQILAQIFFTVVLFHIVLATSLQYALPGLSPLVNDVLEGMMLGIALLVAMKLFVLPHMHRTEQKYTEAVKNLLDVIDSHCIFAVTGEKGIIIDANQKFADISGYDLSELLGNTHRILNSGYFTRDQWDDFYTTLNAGKIWQGNIRNKAKSGRHYWVYTTIKPILEKNKLVACYVLRSDITDMVNQVNQSLKAFDEIQEAEQRVTTFTNHIVHELRTPIHIITNFNAILSNKLKQQVNKDMLNEVQSTVDHMGQLVNELLDISKIRQGKFELQNQDFDLYKLLTKIGREFQTSASNSSVVVNVNIDSDVPHFIHGDESRLKQVIYNLMSNAKKFTPRGSITLLARLERYKLNKSTLEKVVISVADTGVGIAADDLGSIFKEFYQVKNAQSKLGTGLGLAISRQIINLMNGDIYVESIIGKGSKFSIEIPLVFATGVIPSKQRDMDFNTIEKDALTGKNILVVDDTPLNVLVAKEILEKYGAIVFSASNGEQALTVLEKDLIIDAILMDLHLPEMNGIELTRRIKEIARYQALPVIGMSGAFDEQENIAAALKAGMVETLTKPFEIKAVISSLIKYF